MFDLVRRWPKPIALAPCAPCFRLAGFDFTPLGFGAIALFFRFATLRLGLLARLLDLRMLLPFGFVSQRQCGECQGHTQYSGKKEK